MLSIALSWHCLLCVLSRRLTLRQQIVPGMPHCYWRNSTLACCACCGPRAGVHRDGGGGEVQGQGGGGPAGLADRKVRCAGPLLPPCWWLIRGVGCADRQVGCALGKRRWGKRQLGSARLRSWRRDARLALVGWELPPGIQAAVTLPLGGRMLQPHALACRPAGASWFSCLPHTLHLCPVPPSLAQAARG